MVLMPIDYQLGGSSALVVQFRITPEAASSFARRVNPAHRALRHLWLEAAGVRHRIWPEAHLRVVPRAEI